MTVWPSCGPHRLLPDCAPLSLPVDRHGGPQDALSESTAKQWREAEYEDDFSKVPPCRRPTALTECDAPEAHLPD